MKFKLKQLPERHSVLNPKNYNKQEFFDNIVLENKKYKIKKSSIEMKHSKTESK